MTLLGHHGRQDADQPEEVLHTVPSTSRPADHGQPGIDERVFVVQRLGCALVGATLLIFGLLAATTGVPLLATHGERVLGLSSNGLLAVLSLVVSAILIFAAVRGARVASTLMIVLGVLFLASALGNLALLRTSFNILAFQMSNVLFSVVIGLLLLVLGCYGRVSGNLPADSPYAHPHLEAVEPQDLPQTRAEFDVEAAMREAEIAVVEHHATDDQRRRVEAMAPAHTRADRRRIWLDLDAGTER